MRYFLLLGFICIVQTEAQRRTDLYNLFIVEN